MAVAKLTIPATVLEPALDLVVINGSLWIFLGGQCRPLGAGDSRAVADFTTTVADALADAL